MDGDKRDIKLAAGHHHEEIPAPGLFGQYLRVARPLETGKLEARLADRCRYYSGKFFP